jgi:hypothetical protein
MSRGALPKFNLSDDDLRLHDNILPSLHLISDSYRRMLK